MTIDAVIAKNPPNPSIFAVCFLEPDEFAGATEVFDSLIFRLFGCFCGLLPNTGQVNNPR